MSQNQENQNCFQFNQDEQLVDLPPSILDREPEDQMIELGDLGGSLNEKYASFNDYNNLEPNHNLFGDGQQEFINSGNFEDKNAVENGNYQYRNSNGITLHNNQQNHHHPTHSNHSRTLQLQQKSQTNKNGSAFKKCICKKTQCLKMYCECFANGIPCNDQCICLQCKNTLQHQKQIYQAKLMIRQKGIVGLHSCSLSQKRCNCKKSNCLKKYCECFNSGVKCSQGCKCNQCKNCDNPFKQDDNDYQKKQPQTVAKQQKKKQKKPKQKTQKVK